MASTTKRALISGITGQDGSYLTELLLEKGYEVHGIVRRSSSFNTGRIDHLYEDPHVDSARIKLHYGDLTDSTNLTSIITQVRPDELYNLGAQSHVKVSFEMPEYTASVDGLGALRLLDALRSAGLADSCRFYQASTSELFGNAPDKFQSEKTPFHPRSPYAVAKQFAFYSVVNYREAYGMHASNGILFNHESPRRGPTFVTRKVTRHVARVSMNLNKTPLFLGNLNAMRDWGHARDFVHAMWLIMQQPTPGDYVVATGETHSVRELVEVAFAEIGTQIEWRGTGVDEVGVDKANGAVLVRVDPKYFRPSEVDCLLGDATHARTVLGWKPATTFRALVKEMVAHDQELVRKGDTFS
eukprot:TRINITY_DN18052_c0_g1_i1.p1 TRINITY_DN18052_c0_g1~~TRINITY_DN18052_c0_g1_i1.p1  ORF type:complete len:363 (-),score=102.12 TRINITY_DN18052_c0_g1_i1:81-1148(-)